MLPVLPVLPEEACGSSQVAGGAQGQEGRLYPAKGSCPFKACRPASPGPLFQEPCQPAPHQRLSCWARNPWGSGAALRSSLHPPPRAAGVESSRPENWRPARRRSAYHAPGDTFLFIGSIGRLVPKCWCALQITGIWKTLISKWGLGRSQKILGFCEKCKSRVSPLFEKGKMDIKNAHLSLKRNFKCY